MNVIAIFDIGKTNKKIILFDENYQVVSEQTKQFDEINDDNGELCDDIESITLWITDTVAFLQLVENITIRAFNVSAYGASMVHLDKNLKVLTPLYNYLNPYPTELQNKFYDTYGGDAKISRETASPALGNLNSGLQLYRIKHERPQLFKSIKYSLHLPQYISFVISSCVCSDITSIGCHTGLWDFQKNNYHHWVIKEGLNEKFPEILKSNEVFSVTPAEGKMKVAVGGGLHDSSAALIPYIAAFNDPFILISTGTWCISMNPFNDSPLTDDELRKDCLCYLSFTGNPVKASRLFAGNEHEIQTKRISTHFRKPKEYYKKVDFDPRFVTELTPAVKEPAQAFMNGLQHSVFETRALSNFDSFEKAYHQLMIDIMGMQRASTTIVLSPDVKRIFVDGGFSKNPVFMNLLALSFPTLEVYGATVAQSTSMGAALAIHQHWNNLRIAKEIIQLKRYNPALPRCD
ncbi:hypothetical protein BH09BAC3_BH09BAC3_09120 [soil metagenome]